MKINVEQIMNEAVENTNGKPTTATAAYPYITNSIMCDMVFTTLAATAPLVTMAVSMRQEECNGLQNLLYLAFEMGRLVGRQEIVDDTLGKVE